jgi:hypothetical protein
MWFYFNGKKSYEIVQRDDGLFDLSGGAKAYFAEFSEFVLALEIQHVGRSRLGRRQTLHSVIKRLHAQREFLADIPLHQ